jgi:hypothetical protein
MFAPARRLASVLLGSFLLLGQGGIATAADPSASPDSAATPPAGTTLTAQPSVLSLSVAPGSTVTSTLTLTAGVSLDLTVEPQGLGQDAGDGSFTFLPADKDVSQYSARPYVSVTPSSFSLAAGGAQKVSVTVTLPADAGDGERFALLKVSGKPAAGSGNVGIGVALGVGILVALPGTTPHLAGTISGLAATIAGPGQPVTVVGTIENSGDTHYGARPATVYQQATIHDVNGTLLGTGRDTLTGNSVIPTFGRRFSVDVAPAQPLPAGRYKVDVEVGLTDGTVLATSSADLIAPGGAVAGAIGGPSTEALPMSAILMGVLIGVLIVAVIVLGVRSRRRPAVSQ